MAEKHNTLINSLLKWISIDQFFLASICRNFFTQNAWFIFLTAAHNSRYLDAETKDARGFYVDARGWERRDGDWVQLRWIGEGR